VIARQATTMHRGFFMSDLTLEEIKQDIADTRSAIREVLTSQSLSGSGGTVVRAQLKELREHLKDLRQEYRIRSGIGGPAINIGTMKRT